MKIGVGDLVEIIGSLGEGPELTSVTGVIVAPWQNIPGWWEILTTNYGIIHWPEANMAKAEERDED